MSGYSGFARMIGKRPELGVFRTFAALQAQNLLFMQNELLQLEFDMEAFVSLRPMQAFDKGFVNAVEKGEPEDASIWSAKFAELREKLKPYNDALLQAAAINSLSKPQSSDLGFLRQWIDHRCGGDSFLGVIEGGPWREPRPGDLIQLSGGRQPGDRFAESISNKIVPVYHRLLGRWLHRQMDDSDFAAVWEYRKGALDLLGNLLCMFLSAFVPTISILVLYFLKSVIARLIAIIIFSLLFSLLMTFVVEGRRSDVWAATTAFAAVQVVFIGVGNS